MTMQLFADSHQLRSLALRFEAEARAIDEARNTASAELRQAFWQGNDAGRFTDAWFGQHATQLDRIAQMLRSSALSLRQQAVRQDSASQR
jgi:hypothetical protein